MTADKSFRSCSESESNTCCNSYYIGSLEDRILKCIDDAEVELTPIQISQKVHAVPSTVRVYLRRMLEVGKMVQPSKRSYCNKITYGLIFVPLRAYNIRLRCFVEGDLEHWEKTEAVGSATIHICFGEERRKISGFIACDRGMNYDACLFALNRWFDLAESHLGRAIDMSRLLVKTFKAF
jgi:hypothetical protein